MLWYTTLVTLTGLILLWQLLHRWLLLSRRKIMVEHAKLRLQEAQQRDLNTVAGTGPGIIAGIPITSHETRLVDNRPSAKQIDLAEINAQTMRLVSSILVVTALPRSVISGRGFSPRLVF